MKDDPIVTEVRQRRREILESYDWDFEKMSKDVMVRQWQSGHKVVSRPKRKLQQGAAPNAHPLSGKE
ncbi:MAG: hypothetical protein C4527_06145 [Candidatus Omnitrophota bacterium]|jgi:hypothetical protein|nr:MAG: hypothetical protein C4527_06145 [Candidatus Omnitrophota bacterium]